MFFVTLNNSIRITYYTIIKTSNIMKKTENLVAFFEEKGFQVHLFEEDDVQSAEIEKWTEGGVDMIILLRPFSIKSFIDYVEDFNVDNEIDLHRKSEDYKRNFTISESVEDFKEFYAQLVDIVMELEETIKPNILTKSNVLDKITAIQSSLTSIEIEAIQTIKDVLKLKQIESFDLVENRVAFMDMDGCMITKIYLDCIETENEDGEAFENSYNDLNIDDLLGILSSLTFGM